MNKQTEKAINIEYKIKLSPYAKVFYTEWLLDPNGSRYNLTIDQTFYGKLDINRLKKALKRYISEHVLLNSHIENIDGEPYWIPNTYINELEYSNNVVCYSKLLSYFSHCFDLHNEPLYRFRLICIGKDIYRFVIVLHHLVIDGSSGDGLFKALSNYYNDEHYTTKYSIDEQIKLITNLEDMLSAKLKRNKANYKEFWHNQLTGVEGVDLNFLKLDKEKLDKILTKECSHFGEIRFNYEEEELAKLNYIKHKYVITSYIYSLCIFAILINKYTGQNRLAVGYATSIKEGIDFVYGAQVNTCFIPYKFDNSTTVVDLFDQSRKFFKSLKQGNYNYNYYPVTDIIQESNKSLLNLYFIQPHIKDEEFVFTGIEKVEISDEFNLDSIDPLVFEQALGEKNNKLSYRVRYDKHIVNETLLDNFVHSFKKLFLDVLDDLTSGNDTVTICSYDLLEQEQYRQLIYDFNKTEKNYPNDKTLCQLFEEQVQKTPENIAVIFENVCTTYQELDKKTSQLAVYLKTLGIKAGEPVALYIQRSLDSIVAIISIIKSGALYVPLDPMYPQNRIQRIVEDSGCCFCLTSDELFDQCKIALPINILRITDACKDRHYINTKIINHDKSSLDAAYIMYTSGSTGDPKGIKISHRGIVRLVKNTNYITFEQDNRIAHATSISFDISTVEIWGSLLNGLTLVVIPQDTISNFKELSKLLQEQSITIMCMAPVLFNTIVSIYCSALSQLKYLLICGEKLSPHNIPKFFANNKLAKLINCYGPTESTSYATTFDIPRDWPGDREIPIGKPISNTTAYVLDGNLKLLPIGAIGELCLGGDGLAICYHKKPELTNNKFVNIALNKKNKIKIYKTGDLVRMLPDGNLEFIGRNDFQVKIKGYRVELGEIEIKLNNHPSIKQAVVLVKEYTDIDSKNTNEKYLIAYYVADNQLNETKIQEYLAMQLPKYMLPNKFIHIKELPLTSNGKLDKKTLLKLEFENSHRYIPPSNEQEQLICETFAKVLGLKKVGVDDDFFTLGGNSLKVILLTSILQNYFDVVVADIFSLRTPENIAKNFRTVKNVLKQKLERIKLLYKNKSNTKHAPNNSTQEKINNYMSDIQNWKIDCSLKKSISNVLLTGVTGYLGCHILNQLLMLTNYNIFLLVRANSQAEAVNRISKKFEFYFDKKLNDTYSSRIFIIKSDIEKSDLGLSSKEYQDLVVIIDSVIHSAALVKQYGEYDKFYSANVQATINLLELTKLTKLKDFHYMSTCAVLNFGSILDNGEHILTEDYIPNDPEKYYSVYGKTKLQGEYQVLKYRQYGVKGSIYRLGNLVFAAKDSRAQENVEDNGFFSFFLRFLFKMQIIAQEFSMIEISPIDLTAEIVVKLFDKKQLDNNIYHLINPCLFNLSDFLINDHMLSIQNIAIEKFFDTVYDKLSDDVYRDLIMNFLLYQGWLDNKNNFVFLENILQNRTQYILKQLNFKWLPITSEMFSKYLKLLKLK